MRDWLNLDRRDFLAALGATYGTAASAMAAPKSWFLEYARSEDAPPREQFLNTLCPMCPGGCGLQIRTVHGCAVGVRGNDDHPINRGGLCSRASAVLQDVYNPDRLQHPLQAVGGRGSGRWKEIKWEEAIDLLGSKLSELRDRSPHQLCTIVGRDRGLTRLAWTRFMRAFGSPNLIDQFPEDNLDVDPAVLATHGVRQRCGYDIARARFVLSFSSAWLDAHWSTEQAARAFADFRRGRPGFRPRWVHIEPRYSLTATKADEWFGIRPGTEGILALGIAHVMVREGLYDRSNISRYGFGFEDWTDADGTKHMGFRKLVLQEYSPVKVQEMTGIPEGDVFRLAREFTTNRPAIALAFDGGGCSRMASYDRMAIHCLNALNGCIDVPGGVRIQPDFSILESEVQLDEIAKRGHAMPRLDGTPRELRLANHCLDGFVDALDRSSPYSPEAVILADADPVFESPSGDRLAKALMKVPFVAAFSANHNDSCQFADLIVPTLHGLHRWDFNVANTLTAHPVITISQPVMPPPPGFRAPYDVIRTLANRVGGVAAQALPWANAEAAVDAVCKELYEREKGAAFGPANEESWTQMLEERGWREPFAQNLADFKRDVLAGGGWTDPIYFSGERDRIFQSPSGRFAFSSLFLSRSFEAFPEDNGDKNKLRRCLPHFPTEKSAHDDEFPLDLYVYHLPSLVGVSSPNLPWLNDIAGAYMFEKWRTWLEIHPETAERLGITDHDHVEVRTGRNKMILPVKLYTGLMPEVVAVPFGFGRKTGGRWCAGIGENPARLVDDRRDALTGASLWTKTRVSVHKV